MTTIASDAKVPFLDPLNMLVLDPWILDMLQLSYNIYYTPAFSVSLHLSVCLHMCVCVRVFLTLTFGHVVLTPWLLISLKWPNPECGKQRSWVPGSAPHVKHSGRHSPGVESPPFNSVTSNFCLRLSVDSNIFNTARVGRSPVFDTIEKEINLALPAAPFLLRIWKWHCVHTVYNTCRSGPFLKNASRAPKRSSVFVRLLWMRESLYHNHFSRNKDW